jgi:hypothetical protein
VEPSVALNVCEEDNSSVAMRSTFRHVERYSPWPDVCEIIAPDGQIHSPSISPSSVARFRPNEGPPRCRTDVKPAINTAFADALARICK